jgi:hypothetical protein
MLFLVAGMRIQFDNLADTIGDLNSIGKTEQFRNPT